MPLLVVNSTPVSEWYSLLSETEAKCQLELGQELESYLVYLLLRFMNKSELYESSLALDFLRALQTHNSLRSMFLRDVGDKCLIISGLYPGFTVKRGLSEDYFKNLGINAYYHAAKNQESPKLAELYTLVYSNFTELQLILANLRNILPTENNYATI